MRPVSNSEAERAFQNGVEFHEASVRCGKAVYALDNENEFFWAHTPEIVCMAFAAELYLKCLILNRNDNAKNEHRLDELYVGRLTDEEREAIVRHYWARRGASKERMLKEIKAFASAFVDWRYAHESVLQIDLGALSAFAESVYLAVRELIPAWTVQPYYDDRFLNRGKQKIFVGTVGSDPVELQRAMEKSLHGIQIARGLPQPDVIESEQHNFSLSAPTLNFEHEATALNVNVGGRSDPENGGAGEAIE